MPVDLDALERLAAAATPAPWFVIPYPGGAQVDCGACEVADMGNPDRYEADAAFIAAANPATVMALVARVRQLEAALRRYGSHEHRCVWAQRAAMRLMGIAVGVGDCTCGLDAALAGTEAP